MDTNIHHCMVMSVLHCVYLYSGRGNQNQWRNDLFIILQELPFSAPKIMYMVP